MTLPEPEDLLRDYEAGRIGVRPVIAEILRHLIILVWLWEVILHRHNELNQDIQAIADQLGLSRPSQTTNPWYKRIRRQVIDLTGSASRDGGTVASSESSPDEA